MREGEEQRNTSELVIERQLTLMIERSTMTIDEDVEEEK